MGGASSPVALDDDPDPDLWGGPFLLARDDGLDSSVLSRSRRAARTEAGVARVAPRMISFCGWVSRSRSSPTSSRSLWTTNRSRSRCSPANRGPLASSSLSLL